MPERRNELGQPIGAPLPGWSPPPRPTRKPLQGRHCALEPLDRERHARALFEANAVDGEQRNWTYLFEEPYCDLDRYAAWIEEASRSEDPLFFAIIDASNAEPVGLASYLRIVPAMGSIEVGNIHFSERMKRSALGSEAMFLMMKEVFELGYRRCEWKCDSLNAASRAAAERFGFSYEGIFRQAVVYKGRNRDTAWYAAIDSEWPALRGAFERWLASSNFDEHGRQRLRLSRLTAKALAGID